MFRQTHSTRPILMSCNALNRVSNSTEKEGEQPYIVTVCYSYSSKVYMIILNIIKLYIYDSNIDIPLLPMLPICYTCQFSADHRVPQGPLLKPRRQGANPDLIPATLGVLHDAGHRLQQARRQGRGRRSCV